MKCILLSCVFQNRKIILKFYEPTTNKIIMVQNTDYKQSCYIKRDEATKLQGMMGINNIQDVDIYDIVKDQAREMSKVSVDNPSVIYEPELIQSVPERHSKKPNVVRDRIVELCGDIPRVELFAREFAEGWDSWGDEL